MPGMDRKRELARAKLERQMARRAARARRRRRLQAGLGAAIAVVVVLAGVWFLASQLSSGDKTTRAAGSNTDACAYVKADGQTAAKDVGVPTVDDVVRSGTQTVTLKTDAGTIAAQLDLAGAPCTGHSFAHLAAQKYFDGTTCHRLTTKGIFVLQCGDPTGTGQGGPGYQFANENLPTGKDPAYPAGTLAMANAGPDTNGSQFFIVYKDTQLSPDYTVFGKVTSGLDVVQKVAAQGVRNSSGDGAPKRAVRIDSVTAAAPGQ